MTIGPVQLIVPGFTEPDFHGSVIAELERLSWSDTDRYRLQLGGAGAGPRR